MDIASYLDQRHETIQKDHNGIRDACVFDFNYMPDEPLMREEAKPVIDACLRFLNTGIPNHLFIFGSRGSGKTLTVRHIARLMEHRGIGEVRYANCRQHNTSFKILAHLLGVRPRGHSLDELWERFCGEHSRNLILILDEVDLLSDKDRNKDILYLLSRSMYRHMVIMLSNQPRFVSILDESIRSSLQPEMVHFRDYDAQQILAILQARASLGLRRTNRDALAKIAALTRRHTNADVRVAIKTLYYLAVEQSDDVQRLFDRARRDLVADVLANLNDRNLLILKAASGSDSPLVKSVYARYRQLSQKLGEEPYSYMYFYTNLSYLQSIGLIMLVSTKVRRTYTNQIQVLCDEAELNEVASARFR